METMLLQSNLDGVEYRGEGNSGLVVALKESRRVLKLKKTPISDESSLNAKDWFALHEYQVGFTRLVAVPILGPSLIHVPDIALLREDDIVLLNSAVRKKRASHRLRKTLSPTLNCGLLFDDYCIINSFGLDEYLVGPVLCVELKTKMGFMPNYLDHQTKSNLCRFHLVQNRKLRQHRITDISGYCPLDLYSGCEKRMHGSLLKLLSNPQNNLRIFRDGCLVFGGERDHCSETALSKLIDATGLEDCDDFTELILMALCMPLPEDRYPDARLASTKIEKRSCIYSTECGCDIKDIHTLPTGCVLDRLLLCQQLCLSDVSEMYADFLTKSDAEKNKFFHQRYPTAEIPPHLFSQSRHVDESAADYEYRLLWKCLVALTCRDASIMITMQQLSKEWDGIVRNPDMKLLKFGDKQFIVSIGVIDLEPKSVDRIHDQLQADLSTVQVLDTEI